MKNLIAMTDEARDAVRYNGPTDKQLLEALLLNETSSIPSSRHIRWMAAEILKQRKWKIKEGYVGKRSIKNAILVSPRILTSGRTSLTDVYSAREALGWPMWNHFDPSYPGGMSAEEFKQKAQEAEKEWEAMQRLEIEAERALDKA